MFKTDMGSLAFQNIYDLVTIDKSLIYVPETDRKDMPNAVGDIFPDMMDSFMDIRETINEVIVRWLIAVINQERDTEDVREIDRMLDGVLGGRGVIDEAIERSGFVFE